MRNIPFAFLNEETIEQIEKSEREVVNGFGNLAGTQRSMRGVMTWPEGSGAAWISAVKRTARRFVAMLERMMEMSGPNSIANLERAIRARAVGQRIK